MMTLPKPPLVHATPNWASVHHADLYVGGLHLPLPRSEHEKLGTDLTQVRLNCLRLLCKVDDEWCEQREPDAEELLRSPSGRYVGEVVPSWFDVERAHEPMRVVEHEGVRQHGGL